MSKSKGLSNKQASYLAALQKEAGESYSGRGMSRQRASLEIERLRRRLPKATPVKASRDNTRAQKVHKQALAKRKRLFPPQPSPIADLGWSPEPQPSSTQLHDIAVLCRRMGKTAPQPATRGEAARILVELRRSQSEQP